MNWYVVEIKHTNNILEVEVLDGPFGRKKEANERIAVRYKDFSGDSDVAFDGKAITMDEGPFNRTISVAKGHSQCKYYGKPAGRNSPLHGQRQKVNGPGNAAVTHEALAIVRDMLINGGYDAQCRAKIVNICDAALSAPAKNCDKYRDEETAQTAFLNDEWLISVDSTKDDPFDEWTEPMKSEYAKWLMKPIKEEGEQ